MMFSARERDVFRQAYAKADDDTWARARGWALSLALAFMPFSADNPLMADIGERTFREVLGLGDVVHAAIPGGALVLQP